MHNGSQPSCPTVEVFLAQGKKIWHHFQKLYIPHSSSICSSSFCRHSWISTCWIIWCNLASQAAWLSLCCLWRSHEWIKRPCMTAQILVQWQLMKKTPYLQRPGSHSDGTSIYKLCFVCDCWLGCHQYCPSFTGIPWHAVRIIWSSLCWPE